MSTDRDPEAVLAAWLEEGPTELPDQNRRLIRTAAQTMSQRRRGLGLAWRYPLVNGYMRPLLAIATIVIVAVGGIYLLRPGQPDGQVGGPGLTPTASPIPTSSASSLTPAMDAGVITLTDVGCTWNRNPSPLEAGGIRIIEFRNETEDFGNFGLYRLDDDATWDVAVAHIAEVADALGTGADWPPMDFAVEQDNVDVIAGLQDSRATTFGAGTYGIVCSANEPPPGEVFSVFLVGPLEVE